MKICPKCKKEYETGKFCNECGSPLEEVVRKLFCPNCGTSYESGTKFCGECGEKLSIIDNGDSKVNSEESNINKNFVRIDLENLEIYTIRELVEEENRTHNPVLQDELGDCYYFGKKVPQDIAKSIKYYSLALSSGNPETYNKLGKIYFNGKKGVVRADEAKAFSLFMKAAELGSPEGMNNLSYCFRHGFGCDRDCNLADYWSYKAKANGFIYAK